MVANNSYGFGVEIELLLRPKSNNHVNRAKEDVDWKTSSNIRNNRTMIWKLLRYILRAQNIQVFDPDNKSEREREREREREPKPDFSLWKIEWDTSLDPDESHGYLGVELISPILYAHDDWQFGLSEVYDAIDLNFDILGTNKCGTHVHITPFIDGRTEWEVGELRCILKAVCLFDQSIGEMMPDDRKICSFAYSNFDSGAPKELSLLYDKVVEARRDEKIGKPADGKEYEPAFEAIDKIETAGGFGNLYASKYYSFNFRNLADGQTPQGTIEFRRPPASTDTQTCAHWAVWIMAFMAKATSTNWNLEGGIPRKDSVDALKDFIIQGVGMLPEISQNHLCHNRLCKQVGGQKAMTEDERREAEEHKRLKALQASSNVPH